MAYQGCTFTTKDGQEYQLLNTTDPDINMITGGIFGEAYYYCEKPTLVLSNEYSPIPTNIVLLDRTDYMNRTQYNIGEVSKVYPHRGAEEIIEVRGMEGYYAGQLQYQASLTPQTKQKESFVEKIKKRPPLSYLFGSKTKEFIKQQNTPTMEQDGFER